MGWDEDMYVFRVKRLFPPWHALQKNWDVRFAFIKTFYYESTVVFYFIIILYERFFD
jgi:hypothetical protein